MTLAPEWFERSIATPYDSRFIEIDGCSIHYLRWGDSERPGLLFVPGAGGHAHWFSHVAPLFTDQFHVVAMDIAGCGDSGRRDHYTQDSIVAEIMGVCAHSGMLAATTPPVLAGHSVGGQHVVRAAIAHGKSLLGVIAIDALRYAKLAHDPAVKALKEPRTAPRQATIYRDYQNAVARFRLIPPPSIEIETDYVLDHIARHSLRAVEGGWTWKFDAALTSVSSLGLELKDVLRHLPCQSAAIYGEHTHLADDTLLSSMTTATNGMVPLFIIQGSTHYPMIDNPLAFVAAVKGITLAWIAAGNRRQNPE
jgi:pimeloyl-ACP methyl ester carboxylesterase